MLKNNRFLAAFTVAILATACGPADTNDPGKNPTAVPTNPDKPDDPVIEMATRGLSSNPTGHVLVDGVDTGMIARADTVVTIEAPVGMHTIDIVGDPSRPEITRITRIPNVRFAAEMMGEVVDLAGYRNYTGEWAEGSSPAAPWAMDWNANDVRCPGTNVLITGTSFGVLCVYPDNTLATCAGPDANGDGVPDGPADASCTEMVWGRTIDDPDGVLGEEVVLTFDAFATPGTTQTVRYKRLVPPWK